MANKIPKKKKTRSSSVTPYALVRSNTGRAFQRCGIRFQPDADEPVNLDKLTASDREHLTTTKHLTISYISAEDYAQALSEQQHDEQAAADEMDVPALVAEVEALRAENAAQRAEIALLTGRRSGIGGPRENDDKPATKPLIG